MTLDDIGGANAEIDRSLGWRAKAKAKVKAKSKAAAAAATEAAEAEDAEET